MVALEVLPDVTSIKTRFPEFESVDAAAIGFAIEEASRFVDDSWPEGDRLTAVTYLVGHYLAIAGASAGVDGREVVSETIGPISVTYAGVAAAASQGVSNIGSSAYGKKYAAMARRWFGGPISIS